MFKNLEYVYDGDGVRGVVLFGLTERREATG